MVEELTILTAREAAEYLRVSLYTLRRMETKGSLGIVSFGLEMTEDRFTLFRCFSFQKGVEVRRNH
jgi:excisionase family DNA binding protein